MMNRPAYFGFVSNASPLVRCRIIESLTTVWTEDNSARPVLIDFDPGISLPKKGGRSSSEDAVARYGNAMGSSDIPVLKPSEAAEFFEDAARPRNSALVEGRSFLALVDEVPGPDSITLFDALCFAITIDHASIAFMYGAIKTMESARKRIPARVMIVGEPKIEKAAEFYAMLARELKSVGDKFAELSFAGFLAFDQEESDLAAAYGVPIVEAFPEGTLRGQAKFAIKKLFLKDFSEIEGDWPEREKRFALVARTVKT